MAMQRRDLLWYAAWNSVITPILQMTTNLFPHRKSKFLKWQFVNKWRNSGKSNPNSINAFKSASSFMIPSVWNEMRGEESCVRLEKMHWLNGNSNVIHNRSHIDSQEYSYSYSCLYHCLPNHLTWQNGLSVSHWQAIHSSLNVPTTDADAYDEADVPIPTISRKFIYSFLSHRKS
jgi:hypothetical protein